MSTACVFNTVSLTVPGSNDIASATPSSRLRTALCTALSPSGSTFFSGRPVLTRYLTGVSPLPPLDSPLCAVRRPTRHRWGSSLPSPIRSGLPSSVHSPRIGVVPQPRGSSRPGATPLIPARRPMRGAPPCRSPPRCTFRALAPAGGTKPTRRSLSGPTAGTTSKPEPRTGGKQWKLWWRKRLDRRRIDLADRRPRKRAKADARTLAHAAVLAASDPNVVAVVVVTYTQSREAVIGEHTDPDHPGAGHKDAPERICSDPTASAHEGCSPNTRASAQPRTRDLRTVQMSARSVNDGGVCGLLDGRDASLV